MTAVTSAVVYAPHRDASDFYRLVEPARVLGVPVVRRLPEVRDAAVVILNRPFGHGLAEQVRIWAAEGRRVVIDQDDCFDTVHPRHRAYGTYETESMHLACKNATTVIASTPAIAERYGHGHGIVVRNRVPAAYLDNRRSRETDDRGACPLWVVWYGSLGAHPEDPQQVGGALGGPMREAGAEFAFFGPPEEADEISGCLGHDGPVHARGYYSLSGLMANLPECDLGIVPLELSAFNSAKSYLKGLEMAAAGLPVLASPTPEYRRMAREGACIVAQGPDEWAYWGRMLLGRDRIRAELAEAGKAWATGQTYERAADEWRAAWFG